MSIGEERVTEDVKDVVIEEQLWVIWWRVILVYWKVGGKLTLSDPTLVSFYTCYISILPPSHFLKPPPLSHTYARFTRLSSLSFSFQHTNQPPSFSFIFFSLFLSIFCHGNPDFAASGLSGGTNKRSAAGLFPPEEFR